MDGALITLHQQQGADQARDRSLVRNDAGHVAAALDLAIEMLERAGAVQLGPVLGREPHAGQHVGFRVVHQPGQLRHPRPSLIGDLARLPAGGFGIVLGECSAGRGGDDATLGLARRSQGIAHEVYPAALPHRAEDLADGACQALVRVRDHQVRAAWAATRRAAQKLDTDGSAWLCPTVIPPPGIPAATRQDS